MFSQADLDEWPRFEWLAKKNHRMSDIFEFLIKASFYLSGILTLAIIDLLYGCFVSPFFVENYVQLYWNQSAGYCQFFEFYFTFHDFFVPLILILLSTYVSLKYSGATIHLRSKKTIYMAMFAICLLFSVFLSIPATLKAAIFIDDPPGKYSDKFGIFQTCLNTL